MVAGVEVGGQSALLHALHDAPARLQQKRPVLVRRLAAGTVLEVDGGEVGQPLGKLEAHLMVQSLQALLQPLGQERALVLQSLHKVLHVIDVPVGSIVLAQDLHLLDDPRTKILKLQRRELLIQRRPGHEVVEAPLHVLHAAELFLEALVMRGIEGLEVPLDHQLAALPELPSPGPRLLHQALQLLVAQQSCGRGPLRLQRFRGGALQELRATGRRGTVGAGLRGGKGKLEGNKQRKREERGKARHGRAL
mmetsp:Transcript_29252/g.69704  ORF Transcript_29252/g.69704 Transcript_29252/m.69704 type:complete len:250 (+) Transcript_29252:1045-1794(+)